MSRAWQGHKAGGSVAAVWSGPRIPPPASPGGPAGAPGLLLLLRDRPLVRRGSGPGSPRRGGGALAARSCHGAPGPGAEAVGAAGGDAGAGSSAPRPPSAAGRVPPGSAASQTWIRRGWDRQHPPGSAWEPWVSPATRTPAALLGSPASRAGP